MATNTDYAAQVAELQKSLNVKARALQLTAAQRDEMKADLAQAQGQLVAIRQILTDLSYVYRPGEDLVALVRRALKAETRPDIDLGARK